MFIKLSPLLLTLFLLQSCTTQPVISHRIITPSEIPSHWQASGRIGVVVDGKAQNSSINIKFKNQEFELKLTSALGLGQIKIVSNINGLKINDKKSSLNVQQWMSKTLGWYFPLEKLPDIIFKHRVDVDNAWQVKLDKFMPFQNTDAARLIKLKHQHKSIKIKLLFKQVNQLK